MPKRWLVDYDSTICDTQSERLVWVNNRFGKNYRTEDVTQWHNDGLFTEEEEAFMWGPECFLNEAFQSTCPPVEGAIEGMQELIERGEHLMIISDRPASLFDVTRQWLDWQGLDMVRLLLTAHRSSMSQPSQGVMSKYQAAWSHKLTHVLEDGPHHAEKFAEKPWIERVYLLDMPYNRDVDHPKITRVADWAEFMSILNEREAWLNQVMEAGVYV